MPGPTTGESRDRADLCRLRRLRGVARLSGERGAPRGSASKVEPTSRMHGRSHLPARPFQWLTIELILKIGRMIAIAMKPTTEPITMIMIGSIMLVTVLIVSRSCFE